jgi:membrane protease YdiL (CAAX protease family)
MPSKLMPTVPVWRQAALQYWQQSQRPLAALALVLPLLALYEAGVLLLGNQAVRNGADVWLRQILDLLGLGHYLLLPLLTLALLLAWHHVRRDPWQLSGTVPVVMFAECAVWGLLLMAVGRLQATLVSEAFLSWRETAEPPTFAVATAISGSLAGRLLGFAGAGVYEEVLFRLLLVPGVQTCAERLGARRHLPAVAAIVLTSLIFSAAHYVGPHGDAFDAFSFSFRALAGVFFSVIFVYRGFGIAAGTHALYDVFVSLG